MYAFAFVKFLKFKYFPTLPNLVSILAKLKKRINRFQILSLESLAQKSTIFCETIHQSNRADEDSIRYRPGRQFCITSTQCNTHTHPPLLGTHSSLQSNKNKTVKHAQHNRRSQKVALSPGRLFLPRPVSSCVSSTPTLSTLCHTTITKKLKLHSYACELWVNTGEHSPSGGFKVFH